MNTTIDIKCKLIYTTPTVECVKLDNEIALVLASNDLPPEGPSEGYNAPEHFNNSPYNINLG